MNNSVGEASQGRLPSTSGQRRQVGLASQVQDGPQAPALAAPDRNANCSAMHRLSQALATAPVRPTSRTWLVTEPVLKVCDPDFIRLRLPSEVWTLILRQLPEIDLVRTMSTCRGLYGWGRELAYDPLHPESTAGERQRADCDQRLAWIGRRFLEQLTQIDLFDQADVRTCIQLLQSTLKSLAMRNRCLEVEMVPGLENAVVEALLAGPRWQSVQLKFDFADSSSDSGCGAPDIGAIQRLEKGLAERQRKAVIDLVVTKPTPDTWPGALPDNTALLLTGLQLHEIEFRNLDELQGLKDFLESDNALERLAFRDCDGQSDLVLTWLKKGSHKLSKLHLANLASDHELLLEVLKSKPELTVLGFDGLRFNAGQLTLRRLLDAVPKLEELNLGFGGFEVAAMRGSHDALAKSSLREIEFDSLVPQIPKTDAMEDRHAQLRTAYDEFSSGLSAAPNLQVLTLGQRQPPNSDLWHSQMLLLHAFEMNPQARFVCLRRGDRSWEKLLTTFMSDANTEREQKGWPRVELRAKTAYGMQEIDPDEPRLFEEDRASEDA